MKTLILASASPRRREILKQVGIDFTVIPSTKEEVITKQEPKDAVMELALQKAEDVAGRADGDCMVIGADTVVAMEGSILGKPEDKDDAARMLRMLSGSRHQVYTGVACICGEKKHVFYEETSVFFYPVSEDEIRCYIETGEPMDKAGAYGIQGRAARFIRGFEGDYYNVVGFPVARFLQVLKKWDEQSSRI
ncbi:Maf family protein [Anaerostipes caccae]|uniref:Maf family protein n=1 Tax=Anaerostipes caccae TaxID=105841 RepID=UPI00399565F6